MLIFASIICFQEVVFFFNFLSHISSMSDVDARASEEADCGSNERELDRFIYSGKLIFLVLLTSS